MVDESPTGFTNWDTSLALDSRGVPNVAYVLWGITELRYAVRGPTGWIFEVADSNHYGEYVSLKLDRLDRPHIAFYNGWGGAGNRSLVYVHSSGGVWRTETVEAGWPEWNCGLEASLALDSLDRPGIAYVCERDPIATEGRLMYASWNGMTWTVEMLASNRSQPSLAFDSDGRAHISDFDEQGLKLEHRFYDGSAWIVEVVDTNVNLTSMNARTSSIVVDSLGDIRIAYNDIDPFPSATGRIKYARRVSSNWTSEVVDSLACGGTSDLSLALDPSGKPGVAYYACKPSGSYHLAYAWNDSTGWSTEVVDSAYGSGVSPSLAFDRWGSPHISYLDGFTGRVMYAAVPSSSPDFVPEDPQPPGPLMVSPSQPLTLSINVTNLGAAANVSSTLAFYNNSTPSAPFALFIVPPLGMWNSSGPYVVTWTSPAVQGTYTVVSSVDHDDNISELDETNNLYTWIIDVLYSLQLTPGHRLMSFPVAVSNTYIGSVLSSVSDCYDYVRWYDPLDSSDHWKSYAPGRGYNDLTRLDNAMGFWINITASCSLVTAGTIPVSTTIQLHQGWNMVGFPSFNTTYTVADMKADIGLAGIIVEAFDANAAPYYLQRVSDSYMMAAGEGYWVFVPSDATWTIGG